MSQLWDETDTEFVVMCARSILPVMVVLPILAIPIGALSLFVCWILDLCGIVEVWK